MKKNKEVKLENDVREYFKDKGEVRVLSQSELRTVHAFNELTTKYNLNNIRLIPFAYRSICIFKTDDNLWHVWQIENDFSYHNEKEFRDLKQALCYAIDNNYLGAFARMHESLHNNYLLAWSMVSSEFDFLLEKPVTKEELVATASQLGYAQEPSEKKFKLD